MANQPNTGVDDEFDKSRVQRIEREQLSWSNLLKTRLAINAADKEEKSLREQIIKLGRDEAKNAVALKDTTIAIQTYEKELAKYKEEGNRRAARQVQKDLADEQKKRAEQLKTAGGAIMAMSLEAKKRKEGLEAERSLIKDINKQRGVGAKLADLFRSKEKTQQTIDIARAKAGGGLNVNQKKGEGGGGGDQAETTALAAAGPYGAIAAAIKQKVDELKAPFKELGNQIKAGLAVPFADAANLLTGEDYGMGGGKAKASGATSLLGGISSIVSKIPGIGGVLGGVVDAFKAMLDAVLGIEQANFRVGRALNISAGAADQMRTQFDKIAVASDNVVVNSTRMLQSQIEISKQLGTNKQLSADILVNDVKLRDVLGLEAESRQKIAEATIVTGRKAPEITKSVIGTVGAFNSLVKTSFKFNDIIGEASKLSGVMGLTFAKYPEKLTKALLSVKTLGFELKQLDSTAESFLDFEGSISKEMEAQVLTGRDMNLTAAREAALNNDNAKLAQEITKNIGDANSYLKMNRIQQEAIAQSVGMSRDSLADVLKKQELYSKLGATDVETFNKKIELLEKQGKTQEQISAMIGKDAYNTYTQVSTAEKLSEIMERIKKVFVDFVKNSGLFDFLTSPEKINNFIKGMADKLASTIQIIGDVIAGLIDAVGSVVGFFGGDSEKYEMMAAQVRDGSFNLGNSIRASTDSLGGPAAGSISKNKEKAASSGPVGGVARTTPLVQNGGEVTKQITVVQIDGREIARANAEYAPSTYKK